MERARIFKSIKPFNFPTWNEFLEHKEVSHYSLISWSICKYDNECIEALYGKRYIDKILYQTFDYSKEGYHKACKWIENCRKLIIQDLLNS